MPNDPLLQQSNRIETDSREPHQRSTPIIGGVINNFQTPKVSSSTSISSNELPKSIAEVLSEAEKITPFPARQAAVSAAIGETPAKAA